MRALARGCLSKHLQQQGLKRRRRIFHRLGTTCGETPSFRGTHGGLFGNPSRSPSRWNAAHDGRHLGQWTMLSFAGGHGKRSWSEGLAQAGSPAGGLRASDLVRWVRQGCASRTWRRRLLQPLEPRACDRRCPGHEDRGNEPWSEQSHQGALGAAKAESGPRTKEIRLVEPCKG